MQDVATISDIETRRERERQRKRKKNERDKESGRERSREREREREKLGEGVQVRADGIEWKREVVWWQVRGSN